MQNSKNITSNILKNTAANAVAEVPVTEQIDSAIVTTSPGNPAEGGFITVTKKKKKRGDVRAVKTSESNKMAEHLGSLCTECEIPHPCLVISQWSKLRLCLIHVFPKRSPRVTLRTLK
jgi:hypothetical protein